MGAWDVKLRQWSPHLSQLGLSVVVLHLFLGSGSFVSCQDVTNTNYYWQSDVEALQEIWGAWNQSTPDLESNLAGWNSTQQYPCQSLGSSDARLPNWLGVSCLKHDCNTTTNNCQVDIISMSLSNASIVGTLSPYIGNLTWMTTLELTGNPDLTGPLPPTITDMWLNILDLHDNGFTGTIPDNFVHPWNIQQLDLSGNKLTGEYPFHQTSQMDYLQVLSIGGNNFTGKIPAYAFTNKAQLQKLDISNNGFKGYLPDLNFTEKELQYLDISNNLFTGALPDLNSMKQLRYLDVSRNGFEGPLPDLTQLPRLSTANLAGNRFVDGGAPLLDVLNNWSTEALTMLNLSNNQLTGPLSSWNSSTSLGSIQKLYLDNNLLSGTLDVSKMFVWGLLDERFSEEFSSNSIDQKLNFMSLSNNDISHVISDPTTITNTTTVFILQGNPYCDNFNPEDDAQRCYCTQYCYVTPATLRSDRRKIAIIAAVSSVVAVVLILLVIVGAILYKNRRYTQYLQLQFEKKFEEFDVKPTIFPYNELRAATRDFHEDMKLGQGGYGAVYKGVLPNGNVVAVKLLYIKNMFIGMDEFLNEVVLITGMKHRNLVNLKGCCLRENQRLLVYEYVDNYDVDQIVLEKGSRRETVSWPVRLKICMGIARGLHYLHALAHPRVIHRDIKASNVLLDKNLEPKLADFGLALLFPDDHTHIMTVHVAGTKGYLAPEYASLGQLSDKVDVYSFGVLCLEIISGRRNIDETAPLDQVYLSQWAWKLHEEDRLLDLVDPSLQLTDEELRDLERVINVCLLCIQQAADKRPTMARIVHILQSDNESDVQVLRVSKGERPSFESLMSQKSVDYRSTGLESVMEEGILLSNGSHANSHQTQDSLSSGAVELSEIGAR